MLKIALGAFVAVDLVMVAGTAYYASTRDDTLLTWLLVAIWVVALVLVPMLTLRGLAVRDAP